MKIELNHDRYRAFWFCDLESRSEYQLAANESYMANEDIGEVYRNWWQIELLWKFIKMHLKLDSLITKSLNEVTMQIYMALIAYLLLKLMEIPGSCGLKLLDKYRYLQLELSRRCSLVHWSYDLLPETLIG